MKKISWCLVLIMFSSYLRVAYAWEHEIALGYNSSKEIGYDYYNNGFFLNTKIYKFKKLDKTLILTIDGSLADWRATTKENDHLTAAGLAGALRAYFISPENRRINPYLSGSFGPVYLSHNKFGDRDLGGRFSFQITLGIGTEFFPKNSQQGLSASLQLVHYCNAGIAATNRGINLLYLVSLGYMF